MIFLLAQLDGRAAVRWMMFVMVYRFSDGCCRFSFGATGHESGGHSQTE
jgi:hypothetical protein